MIVPPFDGSNIVETDTMVLFWKPPACFSQWTVSLFSLGGVSYNCAEQYMMAQKAKLFNDQATYRLIMNARSPSTQKRLGQQVTNFQQATWDASADEFVYQANVAKFQQNPAMLGALLATGNKLLVEASPMDKIWGIGLRADNLAAHDVSRWRGSNRLGNALMRTRDFLKSGDGCSHTH